MLYVWKPSAWDLKVSATASVRCVAGKAMVYVSGTNSDKNATVDLAVSSSYGSKSFSGATARMASSAFPADARARASRE